MRSRLIPGVRLKSLRLCRPMCGKALPFRMIVIEHEAAPNLRGAASEFLSLAMEGQSPSTHQAAEPLSEFLSQNLVNDFGNGLMK